MIYQYYTYCILILLLHNFLADFAVCESVRLFILSFWKKHLTFSLSIFICQHGILDLTPQVERVHWKLLGWQAAHHRTQLGYTLFFWKEKQLRGFHGDMRVHFCHFKHLKGCFFLKIHSEYKPLIITSHSGDLNRFINGTIFRGCSRSVPLAYWSWGLVGAFWPRSPALSHWSTMMNLMLVGEAARGASSWSVFCGWKCLAIKNNFFCGVGFCWSNMRSAA